MAEHRITLAEDDPAALFLLHRLINQLYPNSRPTVRQEALDAGANAFIEKSYDPARIRRCILEHLPA